AEGAGFELILAIGFASARNAVLTADDSRGAKTVDVSVEAFIDVDAAFLAPWCADADLGGVRTTVADDFRRAQLQLFVQAIAQAQLCRELIGHLGDVLRIGTNDELLCRKQRE